MNDIINKTARAHSPNQISCPMFAVERAHPDALFRFVSINEAIMRDAYGDHSHIIGRTIAEVFSPKECAPILRSIAQYRATKSTVPFLCTLILGAESSQFDTSLNVTSTPDGRDRMVAVCTGQTTHQPAIAAFDDIQYFSSLADFQIQNLITTFETYQACDIFGSEQRIAKLSGMCRTVQRAVEDIKKSVRNARKDEKSETTFDGPMHQAALDRCGTLKALTDL